MQRTPTFSPGFRLSTLDVAVLATGVVGSILGSAFFGWGALGIAFVVGHFFLFCNVFRISRPLELAWAGIFVVLAGATVIAENPGWPITVAVALLTTVVVVAIELRKPSYHGVGWQRINPGLRDWWEATQTSGAQPRMPMH